MEIIESVLQRYPCHAADTLRRDLAALYNGLWARLAGSAGKPHFEHGTDSGRSLVGASSLDRLSLNSCGFCSDRFDISWDGWQTNVIAGSPAVPTYFAVSYVWGRTEEILLVCSSCGQTTVVPMESEEKLRRILRMTSAPGQFMWLDAISIRQSDEGQKAALLPQMGSIFENAVAVLVMLPSGDKRAYEILSCLTHVAFQLNTSQIATRGPRFVEADDCLILSCRLFYALIDGFYGNLSAWAYWRRAWTFQEWTLAKDLKIQLDMSGLCGSLEQVKSNIIMAGTLITAQRLAAPGIIKMENNNEINDNNSGECIRRFETVKILFPMEQAFLTAEIFETTDRIAWETQAFDFWFMLLRLRSINFDGTIKDFETTSKPLKEIIDLYPEVNQDSSRKIMERLYYCWSALSLSRREARFEADLVASWTSMNNIQYAYRSDDSFSRALQKVLRILRCYLFKIYSFNVSTSDITVDALFLEYAATQRRTNFAEHSYLFRTPILTGFADTLTHFKCGLSVPSQVEVLPSDSSLTLASLSQCNLDTPVSELAKAPLSEFAATFTALTRGRWPDSSSLSFTKLPSARVVSVTRLDDVDDAVHELSRAMDVEEIWPIITDPRKDIIDFLRRTDVNILAQKQLVVVNISPAMEDAPDNVSDFCLWAICAADEDEASSQYVVARESINGTLMLMREPDTQSFLKPLAYLTYSDSISGTFLFPVGEDGRFEIALNGFSRAQTESMLAMWVETRFLKGWVLLGESPPTKRPPTLLEMLFRQERAEPAPAMTSALV